MKKSKRRNTIMLLVLLVLGITIGYAILTTTLNIDGFGIVKGNTWDIHWENVDNIDGVNAQTPEIDTAKTTVTYEINLVNPGDYYEFTVDAVNSGTIDGQISKIESFFYDAGDETGIEELPPYIKYSVTYADGSPIEVGQRLDAHDTKTYKVRVEFKKNVKPEDLPEENRSIVSKYTVTYIQAGLNGCGKSFEDSDWGEIEKQIKDPTCTPTFKVGDTKKIKMDINDDGEDEEYTIRLVNTSTPDECKKSNFSQTACGYVFEFVDVLEQRIMNLNAENSYTYENGKDATGSWKYSNLRAYLNNGIYREGESDEEDFTATGLFNKLPKDLRKAIIDTKVVTGFGCHDFVYSEYYYGGYSCNTYAGVYQGDNGGKNFVTYDKLYLYSTHEIWDGVDIPSSEAEYGTITYANRDIRIGDSAYYNTRQIDYYAKLGVNRNADSREPVRKKFNGSYANWWTRTPMGTSQWDFYYVGSEGSNGSTSPQTVAAGGVVPVFRIG